MRYIGNTKYLQAIADAIRERGASITRTLSSISITRNPTKTTYTAGEKINYDGLIVTATYSDSSTGLVKNLCTINPVEGSVINSDTTVTVSYKFDGITKTATFSLEVV